jgi:hypothetical protein
MFRPPLVLVSRCSQQYEEILLNGLGSYYLFVYYEVQCPKVSLIKIK